MTVSRPGLIPPVPLPFWHRSWRTLWRWRPECIECHRRFRDEKEWTNHYLDSHVWRSSQEAPKAQEESK